MAEELYESEKRLREISELLESARSVLAYREFEPTARTVFEACRRLTGAVSGYIALLSDDGCENEVLFLESGGLPCSVDPSLPMPIRGLRARAYREGEAVYDNGFASSEWADFLPPGHVTLENVLFAPLVLEDRVVGLIGLANKPGGFEADDARVASGFAEIAAVALQNSRTFELLEESEARYRDAAENLQRVNEELKGFSHTVSHDLKEPIAVVRLACDLLEELLRDRLPDDVRDDVLDLVSSIDKASSRASSLIESLLELAEAGQVPPEVLEVDVEEVVARVLRDRVRSIEEKGVSVRVGEGMGSVVASPVHVYQLFSNLIGNAIRHNDSAVPEIEVACLGVDDAGGRRFLVRDNGAGVPPADIERIFIPFYRGRDTGDTGIGLATVRKIIDIYGGSISAYNDSGACFEFSIHDIPAAGGG